MKAECVEELIRGNREIEFDYHGNRYSITYFEENGKKKISVCKYNHKPIDVDTPNQVLSLHIGGKTLKSIFSSLPDDAFVIF